MVLFVPSQKKAPTSVFLSLMGMNRASTAPNEQLSTLVSHMWSFSSTYLMAFLQLSRLILQVGKTKTKHENKAEISSENLHHLLLITYCSHIAYLFSEVRKSYPYAKVTIRRADS